MNRCLPPPHSPPAHQIQVQVRLSRSPVLILYHYGFTTPFKYHNNKWSCTLCTSLSWLKYKFLFQVPQYNCVWKSCFRIRSTALCPALLDIPESAGIGYLLRYGHVLTVTPTAAMNVRMSQCLLQRQSTTCSPSVKSLHDEVPHWPDRMNYLLCAWMCVMAIWLYGWIMPMEQLCELSRMRAVYVQPSPPWPVDLSFADPGSLHTDNIHAGVHSQQIIYPLFNWV